MPESKIESLEMTPGDWSSLEASVPPDVYSRIVLSYRWREEAMRPRCGALSGSAATTTTATAAETRRF